MASDFEVLVECVRDALGDSTIAWGVFRVADSLRDSPRRVVWVPTEFRCEGIYSFNPIRSVDDDTLGDKLITDNVLVECNITGVDFEDACRIRIQVLNACAATLGTCSKAVGGSYETEIEGQSGYMWGAQARIVQHFQWLINVPKLPDSYVAVVREIDQTDELQAPDATDETLIIPTPP